MCALYLVLAGCGRPAPISLNKLYDDALLKLDTGDLPSALLEAQSGHQQTQKTDAAQNWRFRLLEAEVFLWQGKFKDSLALLDSPPSAVSASPDLIVRTKLAQGRALYNLRSYPAAESYLADGEALATTLPNLLGEIELAQGSLQYAKGKYTPARQKFENTLQLARKDGQKLLESKALGSLGRLLTRIERYDEALDYSLKALELSQSIKARHVEAIVRLNIGWNYLELGDLEQAAPFFKLSESLSAAAGMAKIQEEALNSLGRLYFSQGNNEAANDYYKRALAVAENLHDEAAIALYMDNLASVSLSLGHLDEADSYNQGALKMQREIHDRREELWSLSTAAGIADARKQFVKGASILDGLLSDKDAPAAVRWEACHELASLYVQTGKRVQAQAEFKKGLAFLDRSWGSIGRDENKFSFSTWAKDFYSDYIRFLVAQHDPVGAMQVAESMRARTLEEALGKTTAKHPALSVVQSFLRTNRKIILAYWLAPEHSYLWAVTPSDAQVFILPPKQEIETRVEQYQRDVTTLGDVGRTDSTGQELYRILVARAQKMIPPNALVVVIPDGSLGKLNFETLRVPSPVAHYWIEDVGIEVASSAALLIGPRPHKRTPQRRLLLVGNPIQANSDYPSLTHAGEEMKRVAQHFSVDQETVISGRDATPSAYQSSHPEYFALIHFATHGFASETRPLESAIILSPDADKLFKLYGREIVKIPLKADIVTISACYGAGKRTYSGEGLVGLAWAFLRAGAHQVVAGLWDVDDRAAVNIMDDFYTQLSKVREAATALRLAKLKMVKSASVYREPYYWAALQLYTGP